MISNYRINLTGCSGIGKTTLALAIAKQYGLKFVSGSYSDLVPVTKNMPHSEMIQQDAKTIFEQDVQVLNARRKAFDMYEALVSDRSYIDSAAYMIQKLSHRLPTCEIEDFIEKCRVLTLSQCGKVIYVPYTKELFDNIIYFSNVQTYGDFQNAYRIFQGLDYQDIERQYGAIVKLIP